MKGVVFHASVIWDAREAFQWCERESSGLGDRFMVALETAFDRIALAPRAYPTLHRSVRLARTHRFPDRVLFREIDDGLVEVIAVEHMRRGLRSWTRRL